LLRPARRLWASRLPDCRLITVEGAVLGWARRDDVPGSLIPALYFEYLRRRHPGALPRVFDHNRQDILSLVVLTGWVARAFNEPERLSLSAEEYVGLGRLWEPWNRERAYQCYRAALELGLSSPERETLLLRLAALAKRGAQWEDACALWETAIAGMRRFDIRPWEELAKYYEHRGRDFSTAQQIVTEALGRAEGDGVPPAVLDSLSHRLVRLTRRLSQAASSRRLPRTSFNRPLIVSMPGLGRQSSGRR
ncbi:MAG: ribonuclease H-like domain-containing protein, partial [Armatimonadota bacterium]